ncbi:MAG: hypothetical protein KR126chlam5_01601, partial [Candidatus Anoxychlamydiales bacterium]|nr:hypothetical protein [Candidatus Anoxychlamydiales bacterium]NGX52948.1 hypothetical protein [Candidatus Anoxychlamydiales bacterium]NGX53288.1 hypothetical protein [Candidatus Anoxychlamydiales bacterium]
GLVAYSHQNKKPSIKFENELTVAC